MNFLSQKFFFEKIVEVFLIFKIFEFWFFPTNKILLVGKNQNSKFPVFSKFNTVKPPHFGHSISRTSKNRISFYLMFIIRKPLLFWYFRSLQWPKYKGFTVFQKFENKSSKNFESFFELECLSILERNLKFFEWITNIFETFNFEFIFDFRMIF